MNAETLNADFALPGILHFDDEGALTRAEITLPNCTASLYLHGAHLTHWQPTGETPVLFLSDRSALAPGEPIRGGIPICWPWFATDTLGRGPNATPGPSHGFARLSEWQFAFAALIPSAPASPDADTLHLTLTLAPNDLSRSLGFDHFRLAFELIFGRPNELTLRLSAANLGTEPVRLEEALHTYFAVADVRQTPLTGLESAKFLDKTDALREKTTPAGPLQLTGWTDRIFPGHTAPVAIHDSGHQRTITVAKQNSATTVVWNPWAEASATIADLPPDAWPHFLCVETVNAGTGAYTLNPGETHTMQSTITISRP